MAAKKSQQDSTRPAKRRQRLGVLAASSSTHDHDNGISLEVPRDILLPSTTSSIRVPSTTSSIRVPNTTNLAAVGNEDRKKNTELWIKICIYQILVERLLQSMQPFFFEIGLVRPERARMREYISSMGRPRLPPEPLRSSHFISCIHREGCSCGLKITAPAAAAALPAAAAAATAPAT